jgi:hypothetical protein
MSSRQTALPPVVGVASARARAGDRIVEKQPSTSTRGRKTQRGPAQPRAEDFRVTLSLSTATGREIV